MRSFFNKSYVLQDYAAAASFGGFGSLTAI